MCFPRYFYDVKQCTVAGENWEFSFKSTLLTGDKMGSSITTMARWNLPRYTHLVQHNWLFQMLLWSDASSDNKIIYLCFNTVKFIDHKSLQNKPVKYISNCLFTCSNVFAKQLWSLKRYNQKTILMTCFLVLMSNSTSAYTLCTRLNFLATKTVSSLNPIKGSR